MSEPTWCQSGVGCRRPRACIITYRTAPIKGRFPGPGLELVQGTCSGCRTTFVGQVLALGGEILKVEAIPQSPGTVAIVPVAQAAVPDEPVKIKVPRRFSLRCRKLGPAMEAGISPGDRVFPIVWYRRDGRKR